MSIGFQFQTSQCDWGHARSLLEELADRAGAWYSTEQDIIRVGLCRAGEILFQAESGCLKGDCQTNVAGAGFHAAAIRFVEVFAQEASITVDLKDPTGYQEHRNFARLRREHFYTWLENLLAALAQHTRSGEYSNLSVCWDPGQYMPANIPGTVVTPIGRFHVERLLERVEREGIEPFAQEFFIWNEIRRDARYYRNVALAMLWEDCCFMPSARSDQDAHINRRILELLERAVELDASLPFPRDEYRLLCRLSNRAPVEVGHLPACVFEYPIGYRRGLITERLGNLLITIPGNFMYACEQDGRDHVYYDALEDNWHAFRFTALLTDEVRTQFDSELFAQAAEAPESFPVGSGECCTAFIGAQRDEDGNVYYEVVAEILSGTQITLVTVSFQHPAEKNWAISILREIVANVERQQPA